MTDDKLLSYIKLLTCRFTGSQAKALLTIWPFIQAPKRNSGDVGPLLRWWKLYDKIGKGVRLESSHTSSQWLNLVHKNKATSSHVCTPSKAKQAKSTHVFVGMNTNDFYSTLVLLNDLLQCTAVIFFLSFISLDEQWRLLMCARGIAAMFFCTSWQRSHLFPR